VRCLGILQGRVQRDDDEINRSAHGFHEIENNYKEKWMEERSGNIFHEGSP
jgi:hypothetical protein